MTELPLDGLLSVEDVARFMSVSTKTVRRMMSRGEWSPIASVEVYASTPRA